MTHRIWTVLLATLVCATAPLAFAQQEEGFEIRKVERLYLDDVVPGVGGERLVELYLRAETSFGEPVENLRPVDLVIRDDGELVDPEEVSLNLLSRDGRGAACVLAIDISRTMKGEPFDRARAAAIAFLEKLGSFDRVAVVTFAGETQVVAGFDAARAEVVVLLEELRVDDRSLNTVLYDGVHRALELIRRGKQLPRRNFVIVFSDGKDSGSVKTLEEIIEVGRGDELQPRTPISTIGYALFGGEGLETLQMLSRETAGEFFHATSTIHLSSFFNEIWRQMMRSYVVRYPGDMDGRRHTVQVTVESASDRRTAAYPLIGTPRWPWFLGVGLLLLGAGAFVLLQQARSPGRLVFVGGDQNGESVVLKGTKIRIGGLAENDLVLVSAVVSRYHAQIRCRGRVAEIEDLNSSNGTFVNGTAIQHSELRPGDKIRIGDIDLVYHR